MGVKSENTKQTIGIMKKHLVHLTKHFLKLFIIQCMRKHTWLNSIILLY